MKLFGNKTTTTEEAPVKEGTKLLVFSGTENGLIPFHTAVLLAAAKAEREILVIDNSKSQDLFSSVPGQNGIGVIGDTYVLSRRSYDADVFSRFDFVIAYLGEYPDEDYFAHADSLFLANCYTPRSITFLSGLSVPEEKRPVFLFCDRATGKVKEKELLKQIPYAKKGDVTLVCDASVEDQAGYIQFLYNGKQKLSGMSNDWKNLIIEICGITDEESEGTYRKMAKNV